MLETLTPREFPHTLLSKPEDLAYYRSQGVLDDQSFEHYQRPHDHFVEVIHRSGPQSKLMAEMLANGVEEWSDEAKAQRAKVLEDEMVALRLGGNLRLNQGGDAQSKQMSGDSVTPGAGSLPGVVEGNIAPTSTPTATTVTNTGAAWGTTKYVGHIIVHSSGVYGVIIAHTATVITIDRWWNFATPQGAAGTTPASAGTYYILPGNAPANIIALSTDATAAATTDTTLTGEVTTNGGTRIVADTYQHTAVSGGTTTTVNAVDVLTKLFTASGTLTAIQKSQLCQAYGTGNLGQFENTFASVNMISADTLSVAWTKTV